MGHSVPLTVNGYTYEAHYSDETCKTVLMSLLQTLARIHQRGEGRTIAFLAGPPAAGKSTLALLLEALAPRVPGCDLQVIGLDGFHHYNDYLRTHELVRNGEAVSLAAIKGAPETFDVEKFAYCLAQTKTGEPVAWPVYDRTVHNPREDATLITAPIVLIEGNWLLLDESPWRELASIADYTIFLRAEESLLRERAVSRKARGGLSRTEAEAHYERTDGPNIRRALEYSRPADFVIQLTADGDLVCV